MDNIRDLGAPCSKKKCFSEFLKKIIKERNLKATAGLRKYTEGKKLTRKYQQVKS